MHFSLDWLRQLLLALLMPLVLHTERHALQTLLQSKRELDEH